MFQFTVIQLTHSLGVDYAFSKEDDVWLFIQYHMFVCQTWKNWRPAEKVWFDIHP